MAHGKVTLTPWAGRKPLVGAVLALLLLVLLAAAWRWTPLNEWLDLETLIAFADRPKGKL